MTESWSDDFEVLHWVVERFESSGHCIEVGEVLRVFPEQYYDSVRESLRRLSSNSYVVTGNGAELTRTAIGGQPMVNDTTDRALRLVGTTPNEAEHLADRILTVLVEGVVSEPDLEKRFKLEAGLKGIGGMTRDVLVDVVAAAIARSTSSPRSTSPPRSTGATQSTSSTQPTSAAQPWSYPYERVAQDHP
jgi:hypothetical protein